MENNYRVQAIRCCVNCSYCSRYPRGFMCLLMDTDDLDKCTVKPVGICDRYIGDGDNPFDSDSLCKEEDLADDFEIDDFPKNSLSETREQTTYCLKDLEEVLNRGPEESVFNRTPTRNWVSYPDPKDFER